jgi:hypothetical protein
MEALFNQFMHIYFWVVTLGLIVALLDRVFNSDKYENLPFQKAAVSFWATVGITLWIMSFKY